MTKELTPKQRRFVAFIVAGDNNGVSYKKAGYGKNSSKSTLAKEGSRLMQLPHIIKAVKIANKAAGIEVDVEADEKAGQDRKVRILKELESIAFDPKGKPNNGKLKALEMLGKYHGMFTDKVQHSTDSSFVFNIIKPNRETKKDGVHLETQS